MEGMVFPEKVLLIWNCKDPAHLDVVEALSKSGFRVELVNVQGYGSYAFEEPCLRNGRNVVYGCRQILDFTRRCAPNFFG